MSLGNDGDSDVNFISAIIEKMEKEHDINTSRVYLTGFSMGGMLTYHCANRIPEKIASFVPVSGYPMCDKVAVGKSNAAEPQGLQSLRLRCVKTSFYIRAVGFHTPVPACLCLR